MNALNVDTAMAEVSIQEANITRIWLHVYSMFIVSQFQENNRMYDEMLANARKRQLEYIAECTKLAETYRREKLAAEARVADMEREISRMAALNGRIEGDLRQSQRKYSKLKVEYDRLHGSIRRIATERERRQSDFSFATIVEKSVVKRPAMANSTRADRTASTDADFTLASGSFDLSQAANATTSASFADETLH